MTRWRLATCAALRTSRSSVSMTCRSSTASAPAHEFVDLERILAAEERAGIDRVVLCPWVPLLFYDVAAEEGRRRCRLQNQGLARLRAEAPERVSVLGAVPLQDPGLAAAEL